MLTFHGLGCYLCVGIFSVDSDKFRDYLLEQDDDFIDAAIASVIEKLVDILDQVLCIMVAGLGDTDFAVLGGLRFLVAGEEFFVEFLAWAETREYDVYLGLWFVA